MGFLIYKIIRVLCGIVAMFLGMHRFYTRDHNPQCTGPNLWSNLVGIRPNTIFNIASYESP